MDRFPACTARQLVQHLALEQPHSVAPDFLICPDTAHQARTAARVWRRTTLRWDHVSGDARPRGQDVEQLHAARAPEEARTAGSLLVKIVVLGVCWSPRTRPPKTTHTTKLAARPVTALFASYLGTQCGITLGSHRGLSDSLLRRSGSGCGDCEVTTSCMPDLEGVIVIGTSRGIRS